MLEMESPLAQALLDRAPLLAAVAAILLASFVLPALFRSGSGIPLFGKEWGNADKRREMYHKTARKIYIEGYQKFKDKVFELTTPAKSRIIVVAPKYLEELKRMPDDVLSFGDAVDETVETKYTGIDSHNPVLPNLVKADLTPALVRLNPRIAIEVEHSMAQEFPPCEDWTPIQIYNKLLRVVAMVSGHVFIGPELCRKEEYIEAAVNYTVDVTMASKAAHEIPPWLRPFKAPFLPEVRRIDGRIKAAVDFMRPVVQARREAAQKPGYQKPDDLLQWLMDKEEQRNGGCTDEYLARVQLGLSFAAIHTTCLTATNVFYNIAAEPDKYIPELREEIKEVLGKSNGVFTPTALQSMKKVDSVLKESARLHPPSYASFQRKVLKSFRLSSGELIPAGAIVEVAAIGIYHDTDLFGPDPERFDGFRYARLREQGAGDVESSAKNQFVSVTRSSLSFGFGRHACPGRFFAANEIKMILCRALLEYDIKCEDGWEGRYPNLEHAHTSVPDPNKPLFFRKAAKA